LKLEYDKINFIGPIGLVVPTPIYRSRAFSIHDEFVNRNLGHLNKQNVLCLYIKIGDDKCFLYWKYEWCWQKNKGT